ncbi:MAG: acyl transferase [Saprospiraceae bacterium]|nr:acyl transferase [Saprospiraceae bacterium]
MPTPDRAELLSALADLTPENFEATALAVFRYQAATNPLFARWLHLLGRDPLSVRRLSEIPCLPIRFFKTMDIKSGQWQEQTVFTSSATTAQTPSRHLVRHLDHYLLNTRKGFAEQYGPPENWCYLALLPAYLERSGSSLVVMADDLISRSPYVQSGFFLHDFERLRDTIQACQAQKIPTILLGVSFALLDFADQYPMALHGITVMETGGMKGRRKELTRQELHEALQKAFQIPEIHSEYGMTELFSQAYSRGNLFQPATTLRVLTTEVNDPFCPVGPGRTGVLNCIDLANLDTCSFIATEDLGKVGADHRFEVLGRLDIAEMRGCNLMVE